MTPVNRAATRGQENTQISKGERERDPAEKNHFGLSVGSSGVSELEVVMVMAMTWIKAALPPLPSPNSH